jgi:hypothetical protein
MFIETTELPMRRIYFIIFGLVLVVLILLVDWREKFSRLTQSQPAQALGEIWADQPDAEKNLPVAADEPMPELAPEAAAPGNLDPFAPEAGEDWVDPAPIPPARLMPAAGAAAPAAPNPRAGAFPPTRAALPPSFQDLPEQPYLSESRQLLQQTVRNYDRISQPARNPNRQPQP